MSADRAASIRARLKRHADGSGQDFNSILTRYGLERLVYRLSVSDQAPNFLLKGALLFALWPGHRSPCCASQRTDHGLFRRHHQVTTVAGVR